MRVNRPGGPIKQSEEFTPSFDAGSVVKPSTTLKVVVQVVALVAPLRRLADNGGGAAVSGLTTPIGLVRYAYEYLEAAILVDRAIGKRPGYEFVSPVPAYYLAMHSIELSFKAYMCSRGMTIGDLSKRKYGHNIRACYLQARKLGVLDHFAVTCSDLQAIRMMMKLNTDHALRYIKTGDKHFPSWAIVEPLAVRLHQVVSALVGYGKTFDTHYPTLNPDVASSHADPSLLAIRPNAPEPVRARFK